MSGRAIERPWPFPIFHAQWYLADSDIGWFVVSPWGGHCGPLTEEAAANRMRELRAFPVWCPACLVSMVKDARLVSPDFALATWKCPLCGLEIDQGEIADMIRVNE